MKSEKHIPTEDRLGKIEMDLQLIKSMLKEVLTNQSKGPTVSGERIMNVNEAVEFLGVEKHVLYAKSASGEIPCFRIGKLYKFKRSELIQWMDAQGMNQRLDTDDYVNRYLQMNILKG